MQIPTPTSFFRRRRTRIGLLLVDDVNDNLLSLTSHKATHQSIQRPKALRLVARLPILRLAYLPTVSYRLTFRTQQLRLFHTNRARIVSTTSLQILPRRIEIGSRRFDMFYGIQHPMQPLHLYLLCPIEVRETSVFA